MVDLAETPYGGPSSGIGVGAAAIVLLIAFGSLLAMGLPIATALMGIGSGLALIALLGHLFPAPAFSPIIAGLIGLGVGVDYALFIVTRVRADLQDGMHPRDGVVTAMRTAGRLIGVIVGLSMVLLLVVFRSVTIAVKAAVMNLLSICAAYGVLVAVTQWGWAGPAFGFPEQLPVTTWVPVFLFVILFGLSMDYEVFLLSKIREEYDRTGDNALAVGRGLAATARVISAAAAIMVVVFLSFVLIPDVSVKQIGLGLAAAVLIDATVVRLVLVPAVMELLGKANWWLPGWLDRRLPARRAETLSGDEPPAGTPADDRAVAR